MTGADDRDVDSKDTVAVASDGRPTWRARLRSVPGLAAANRFRRLLIDPDFREAIRLEAARPADLFQPWGLSRRDRHPELFAFVRAQLGPTPALLSFGCSTGEEVFTLLDRLKGASVCGIDISAPRIATCQRRARRLGLAGRTRFVVAGSADALPPASFDAVFALSVFRHGDLNQAPARCDHRLRFRDFDRVVSGLARCVRPNGLLVIRHANFCFADTQASRGFEPLLRMPRHRTAPCYDADDCLVADAREETIVFRRTPDGEQT